MSPFCKLADPARYVACDWDFTVDAEGRTLWVEFFKRQIVTILAMGVQTAVAHGQDEADAKRRAEACKQRFVAQADEFARRPRDFGRVTILTFDMWRDDLLREHGFPDPFADSKARENDKILPMLPRVCQHLDELRGREQLQAVIEGVFAGNIYDLGSEATAKTYLGKSPDFFAVRSKLSPRPWLIDNFDALIDRLLNGPVHRKAVFFIDNAGSDCLLGALPMMRWMAMRGTRVLLAANERPTLNDMTIHDVRAIWPRVMEIEPSLRKLPVIPVSTGTGAPLLDLMEVSDELNAAASDADLVILEGMGRAVESNIDVQLSCDTVNFAMVKMDAVARRLGGKLYDLVCRFVPAPRA